MHRIAQGSPAGPPPPLAGALAAWLARAGEPYRVVDPVGGSGDWRGSGPLWVHVAPGDDPDRMLDLPPASDHRLFGPGLDDPSQCAALADRFPAALLAVGDPEATALAMTGPGTAAAPIENLDALPITTWAGFGRVGPAFRLLAGRGGRTRSVGHVLREIVYLVETHRAGHLAFDDASLDPAWAARFDAELDHLPWRLTWEGAVDGAPAGRR